MRKITFLSFLGWLFFTSVHATQTIYVAPPANGGSDGNAGTSVSPYATLAKATSVVSEDGAIIYVSAGTYMAGSTAILNAFDQTIIGDNAATAIIDGNNSVSLIDGVTSLQGYNKTVVVKNLAFKNGYMANVSGVTDGGAAIRMGMKTNLVLEDCSFYNNVAQSSSIGFAGAVYFCGNNITVNRCFFNQNASNSTGTQGYGGAITVRHLFNLDNSVNHLSGGATSAIIKNSTFYKNNAFSKGGAVYFNKQLDTKVDDDDATFLVQNCVFNENTSTGGSVLVNSSQLGAGVAISSGSNSVNNKAQTIIFTNNTFCNNYMISAGVVNGKNAILLEGFRYTAYMANNILTSSAANGESIYANQLAPMESGSNNIIDKINVNIDGADFNANALTRNNQVSSVTAATVGLTTNLTNYPVASSYSVPYLSLQSGSMAINAGTDSYLINTVANPSPAAPVEFISQTDILNQTQQTTRDMGACEFISSPTQLPTNPSKSYQIHTVNNKVRVSGLNKNDHLVLYNINGIIVYNEVVIDDNVLINLTSKGLYMVKVNNTTSKFIF